MFKRIRNLHPVTGLVIGVVATLVLSGTALAITDTSFTYSTIQTGYVMIAPADLVPDRDTAANDYLVSYYHAESDSYVCLVAPVHLPQGARMTSVRTSYVSGGGSNLKVNLFRLNPVTGTGEFLISHTVGDDSDVRTFVNDAVVAYFGLVNNALFMYTYEVCVASTTSFYGARIAYTYSSAGD